MMHSLRATTRFRQAKRDSVRVPVSTGQNAALPAPRQQIASPSRSGYAGTRQFSNKLESAVSQLRTEAVPQLATRLENSGITDGNRLTFGFLFNNADSTISLNYPQLNHSDKPLISGTVATNNSQAILSFQTVVSARTDLDEGLTIVNASLDLDDFRFESIQTLDLSQQLRFPGPRRCYFCGEPLPGFSTLLDDPLELVMHQRAGRN